MISKTAVFLFPCLWTSRCCTVCSCVWMFECLCHCQLGTVEGGRRQDCPCCCETQLGDTVVLEAATFLHLNLTFWRALTTISDTLIGLFAKLWSPSFSNYKNMWRTLFFNEKNFFGLIWCLLALLGFFLALQGLLWPFKAFSCVRPIQPYKTRHLLDLLSPGGGGGGRSAPKLSPEPLEGVTCSKKGLKLSSPNKWPEFDPHSLSSFFFLD